MPRFRKLPDVGSRGRGRIETLMAPAGMNTRDFSQIMSLDYAILIRNYIPRGVAELERRKGLKCKADNSVATGITMYRAFTDNIHIVGYGTSVYAVDITTDTWTLLKSDFSTNNGFDGVRTGDYFFVVNGVDSLYRFYREATYTEDIYDNVIGQQNTIVCSGVTGSIANGETLTFSGGGTATVISTSGTPPNLTIVCQATNTTTVAPTETFNASGGESGTVVDINLLSTGDRVTGQTSGAIGTVLEKGSTLVFGNVTGTFQSGEEIRNADSPAGRASLTSALTWANAEVTDAPIGSVIAFVDQRLMIGRLVTDPTAVAYSGYDSGSNPPFTTWAVGTGVDDGGLWNYKGAGRVNAITNYGNVAVIYHENGYTAFQVIPEYDSGGALIKKDVFYDAKIDEGGSRGAINTEKGILSASEAGITQLLSVGQTDVPFSEQKVEITGLLSDSYFDSIDFSDADIVYDNYQEYVYITCARDSDVNNLVIGYSFKTQAIFEITGWSISRFLFQNGVIYGADSQQAKIYELFSGYDDEGVAIASEYVQELPLGNLTTRNNLYQVYAQGLLSDNSEITIDLDMYKRTGAFERSAMTFLWTAQNASGGGQGYNRPYNSPYGGDTEENGLVNSFDGFNARLRNFQRLFIRITCSDQLPHVINYITAESEVVANIRARNIQRQT